MAPAHLGPQGGVVVRMCRNRRYNNDFGVTITECRYNGGGFSGDHPVPGLGVVIRLVSL